MKTSAIRTASHNREDRRGNDPETLSRIAARELGARVRLLRCRTVSCSVSGRPLCANRCIVRIVALYPAGTQVPGQQRTADVGQLADDACHAVDRRVPLAAE